MQQAGHSCVEYVEQLTMLLFLKMADQLEAGADKAMLKDKAHLLLAIANLAAGEPVGDVSGFTRRMNGLLV